MCVVQIFFIYYLIELDLLTERFREHESVGVTYRAVQRTRVSRSYLQSGSENTRQSELLAERFREHETVGVTYRAVQRTRVSRSYLQSGSENTSHHSLLTATISSNSAMQITAERTGSLGEGDFIIHNIFINLSMLGWRFFKIIQTYRFSDPSFTIQ